MRLRSAVIALLVCLLAVAGMAQEITGNIRGIVTDPSGALVSGAAVQVVNIDRNTVVRDVKTGPDGSYVAPYLPVGHYKVIVKSSGFSTYTAGNIEINVNDR